MDPGKNKKLFVLVQKPKPSRKMRSLAVLTRNFVQLLKEVGNTALDLRYAVETMACGHKRRIYDITNVLEGIGLVDKISKNHVKWIGGKDAHEVALKSELEDLDRQELRLDQEKLLVEESIRSMREGCTSLAYVTDEDICNCFSGHILLAVQAPLGTQFNVPIPKAVPNCQEKYQFHIKSIRGPVDVVLLNKRSVTSVPVVLPVPPPKELLQCAKSATLTSDEKENDTKLCQTLANGTKSTQAN